MLPPIARLFQAKTRPSLLSVFLIFAITAPAAGVPQKSGPDSAFPGTVAKDQQHLSAHVLTNAGFVFTEEALGSMPREDERYGQPFIEDHGWHYGVVVRAPGGRCLWLDGAYGPVFEDFADARIMDAGLVFVHAFSPDGRRLAYVIRQAGNKHVVLDGKPGPAEQEATRLIFSADSAHLACAVRRNGREHVLVDGIAGPACDRVGGPISFSPDGSRTAYSACTGNEYYMVVDQKDRRDWPGTGQAVFSPDSAHVAYVTREGGFVLDGRKALQQPRPSVYRAPLFSADGRHVAHVLRWNTNGASAWIDFKPVPLPNGGAGVLYVDFSPDLKRWACTVNEGSGKRVFLEGVYGPMFQGAWGFKFSPDGSRYAYFAQTNAWWVIADGKVEGEAELNPSRLCFSPDSKRLAYLAGRGPVWWMMIDGKPGPKFIGKTRGGLRSYGDEQIPALTTPAFSPDSAHVAYGALTKERVAVWVDHVRASADYDEIIRGGPSFQKDGTLEFLGIRDRVLYRVSAAPKGAARAPGQKRLPH